MKTIFKISATPLLAIIMFVIFPAFSVQKSNVALAQTTQSNQLEYVVLAPLPDVGTESGGVTKISNLASYIRGMFQFLIGLAVLLAVIMIIFGGIEYMTTDAISGKSAGKQRINNALLGLLLAIGSYLILYTIDPSILEIRIGDISTSLKTTTPTGGKTNNPPAESPQSTTVGSEG